MNAICEKENQCKPTTFNLVQLKLIRLINKLDELITRRKTRRTLASLPDYLLKDIGVSRAEAHQEAAKPFWQK
jgi:uncharacterized protein YjiS (DUF1127 family)